VSAPRRLQQQQVLAGGGAAATAAAAACHCRRSTAAIRSARLDRPTARVRNPVQLDIVTARPFFFTFQK